MSHFLILELSLKSRGYNVNYQCYLKIIINIFAMSRLNFREEIEKMKISIKKIDTDFIKMSKELLLREFKWRNTENKLEELKKINAELCVLNVGGKKYEVSLHTLRQRKSSLFYKQILRQEIKKDEETFYDRDHDNFDMIINFYRTGKIRIDRLSEEEKEDLLTEAEFYETSYIVEVLKATPGEVEFVKMEFSGEFQFDGNVVGTNDAKDLSEKTLLKGICANSPGFIVVHFSREVEFEEIEIAGYNGNSVAWLVSNGKGAAVQSSNDLTKWENVGSLPEDFGHTIQTIKLKKSKAKYIKFYSGDLIGIGYLTINEILPMKKK